MFERTWSGYAAALAVITAGIWLSLWGFFEVRQANLEHAQAYQSYTREAEAQQQEAADGIARECAVAPPALLNECLREEIAAHQSRDTDNKDLEAQQEMAFWARWVVYVGFMGLPISMVGLAALVISLAQTRTAIRDTREIGEAQTRAYLHVRSVQVGPQALEPGNTIWVRVECENTGNSPALNLEAVATIVFTKVPRDATGARRNEDPDDPLVLPINIGFPDLSEKSKEAESRGFPDHETERIAWPNLFSIDAHIVVFGLDVFNKEVKAYGRFITFAPHITKNTRVKLMPFEGAMPPEFRADRINEARPRWKYRGSERTNDQE
jgi:hypothetical protein